MGRARDPGAEESRACRPQTQVATGPTGAIGPRIERRPRGAGVWHRALDHVAGGRFDPATDRPEVSSRACVAHSALAGLELPAAGRSGHPAQRACDPTLEAQTLAGN